MKTIGKFLLLSTTRRIEYLRSQLSGKGFGSIEKIERAICDNPSKLNDIQSACSHWKEHIMYAHRRNDADGIREA